MLYGSKPINSLNIKKTSSEIIFSNRKKVTNEIQNIEIDNSVVARVRECKFVGVIIDEHLSWTYHINLISSKIAKGIGSLYEMSHYLTKETTKNLFYDALIYPYRFTTVILSGRVTSHQD